MQTRENKLWLLVKKNHRQSFNHLYEQTVDMLHAYGYRFSDDRKVVEESIQQVYVDFWVNRKQITIHSSFRFYLLKAFRRMLVKKLKEKSKTTSLEFMARLEWVPSQEDQLVKKEDQLKKREQIQQASLALTPRQQEALFLKFDQGLSSPEIAELMHLDVKGVYKLVSTALIRIPKELRE